MNSVASAGTPMAYSRPLPQATRARVGQGAERAQTDIAHRKADQKRTPGADNSLRQSSHLAARAAFKARPIDLGLATIMIVSKAPPRNRPTG